MKRRKSNALNAAASRFMMHSVQIIVRTGSFSFLPIAEVHPLQLSSKSRCEVVAPLATPLFVATTRAQAPKGPQSAASNPPLALRRMFLAPTNLKVPPKDLNGKQIHDIMEQWAGSVGAQRNSCHVEVSESIAPDGHPHIDFAEDSKPMAAVARLMYTMTQEINSIYIAKVKGSDMPVTCGSRRRGQVSPEPFILQPADGPPPVQALPCRERRMQPQ